MLAPNSTRNPSPGKPVVIMWQAAPTGPYVKAGDGEYGWWCAQVAPGRSPVSQPMALFGVLLPLGTLEKLRDWLAEFEDLYADWKT